MPKKSALDKLVDGTVREAKKGVRKAVTGSSDSLKTQVKKKARKALAGSSQTLGTQLKKAAVKAATGPTEKTAPSADKPARKRFGCIGCLIPTAGCLLVALAAALLVQ